MRQANGKPYEPKGFRFTDGRNGRELLLAAEGEAFAGWLCYRHREGQWVTLRKATPEDLAEIERLQNWMEGS